MIRVIAALGFLFGVLFLFVLLPSLPILMVGMNSPSEGIKVGTIIKVSQQGFFNKTCECELIKSGLNNSDGIFKFTALDCKKAQSKMNLGKEVVVHFEKPFIYWRYKTNSGVYVDKFLGD